MIGIGSPFSARTMATARRALNLDWGAFSFWVNRGMGFFLPSGCFRCFPVGTTLHGELKVKIC